MYEDIHLLPHTHCSMTNFHHPTVHHGHVLISVPTRVFLWTRLILHPRDATLVPGILRGYMWGQVLFPLPSQRGPHHKEGWAPKNWCFLTVVLEKTLKSPLDWKEIQPVNPKGVKVAQSSPTLCHPMDSPCNSSGQNTGVGSYSLLQGIFPTQESNWGLLHCRQIL